MVNSELLAKIYERMGENHADLIDRLSRVETQVEGVPDRLAKVEKFQTRLATIGSVLTFVFTSIMAYLGHKH